MEINTKKIKGLIFGIPKALLYFVIGMLLNRLLSVASREKPGSAMMTVIMCTYVCIGILYSKHKESNMAGKLKFSGMIIAGVTLSFILFRYFDIGFLILQQFNTDIILINHFFHINVIDIYSIITAQAHLTLQNTLNQVLHLGVLMGMCNYIDRIARDNGARIYKAIICGAIFMALCVICDKGAVFSVLGFWGVCDIYLHLDQYKDMFNWICKKVQSFFKN